MPPLHKEYSKIRAKDIYIEISGDLMILIIILRSIVGQNVPQFSMS
jgi:hypothetical protein